MMMTPQYCIWRPRGSSALLQFSPCFQAYRLCSESRTLVNISTKRTLRPGARDLATSFPWPQQRRVGRFGDLGAHRGGPALHALPPSAAVSGSTTWGGNDVAEEEVSVLATEEPKSQVQFLQILWEFARPYSLKGALVQATAVVARAMVEHPQLLDWSQLHRLVLGLVALSTCMGFIVGINQIYDVDIDKVNKPHLPLASGELSMQAGWGVVAGYAAAGLAIVTTQFGLATTYFYAAGLLLGVAYSVPPLRFKNHSATALLNMVAIRGLLVNVATYHTALGPYFAWTPSLLFAIVSVTVWFSVMAITKDSSDVEGDRKFGVKTLASVLGARSVSLLGTGLLFAKLAGGIVAAILMPLAFKPHIVIPGHLALATALAFQVWLLHAANYTNNALQDFYQVLWTLFYAECALFPFI